jgi:hypothetical protein
MMPPEWKKEIQQCNDETAKRAEESRKRDQGEQTAAIARPLYSLRDHLDAYIQKQDRYESGKRCREIATIVGLFITAAFTIALATIGALQTYAFIASERAFVGPTATNLTNGFVVGEKFLPMWIDMRNGGKSVANIEEIRN